MRFSLHTLAPEMFVVVLVTKIDECGDSVLTEPNGLQKTFYSAKVLQLCDHISKEIGVARSNIVPVKSYVTEYYLDDDVNTLLLLALERIADNCDDFVERIALSNETEASHVSSPPARPAAPRIDAAAALLAPQRR